MSNDKAYLALRLEGPLQSWGYDSQYSRRKTSMLPTKSAIFGLCCAALGISRGSEAEAAMLSRMAKIGLLVVAIPRLPHITGRNADPYPVRRIEDYHTVQGTRTAEGKIKETQLTSRQYLCDAAFAAVLAGDRPVLQELRNALRDPKWGVWLGRKACVPSAPVLAGIYDTEGEALNNLLGEVPLATFTHQREVDQFEDGTDTLPDRPLCFGGVSSRRSFGPRRVKLIEGKR